MKTLEPVASSLLHVNVAFESALSRSRLFDRLTKAAEVLCVTK